MKKLIILLVLLCTGAVNATPLLFNNDKAGFDSATNGLTFEDFENATSNSSTEVGFNGGTFGCDGSQYCPGFFGISSNFSISGNQSVYFATPDSVIFSFDTAINSFGIMMGGQGDVAPIDLFLTTSLGDSIQILDNYSGPNVTTSFNYFMGIVDNTTLFTSITISASNANDGIFFDNLEFGTSSTSIPEPSVLLLLSLGFAGIRFSRKKS